MYWRDLEQWSAFHSFWHAYNVSNPLPGWITVIRYLITILQSYPILLQCPILNNPSNNEVLTAISYLGDLFIYFSFSPMAITVTFLLLFFSVTLIYIISGYMFLNLMNSAIFVAILQFIYEILVPILFNLAAATLQKSITYYLSDTEKNFVYIGGSAGTTLYFFILFTFLTAARSRSIFIHRNVFQSWSSWNQYVKQVGPAFILLLLPLETKFKNIGSYVFIGLVFLFAVVLLFIDLRLPFTHGMTNVLSLSVDIFIIFLCVINIYAKFFTEFSISIVMALVVIFYVISVFIAICAYNMQSQRLNRFAETVEGNESSEELPDIDSDSEIQFSSFVIDQKISVLVLRHLVVCGNPNLPEFTMFLAENTQRPDVLLESFRILTIKGMLNKSIAQRIMELPKNYAPFSCRQLLCDLQHECFGVVTSDQQLKPFINHLDESYEKINLLLRQIVIAIMENDQKAAENGIAEYSNECRNYEMDIFNYRLHAPNSVAFASAYAQYYLNLRGDYIQNQNWQQRADGLHSSPALSQNRMKGLSPAQTPRSSESTNQSRIKSQNVVDKIKSKAVVYSCIVFCIFAIVCIVAIFYEVAPAESSYTRSSSMFESLIETTNLPFLPLIESFNVSLKILKQKASEAAQKELINNIYNNIIIDNNIVATMSDTIQSISSVVSSLHVDREDGEKALNLWAGDENTMNKSSTSLQFRTTQLNMLTSLILENYDSEEKLKKILPIYFNRSLPIIDGINSLYDTIMDYNIQSGNYMKSQFLIDKSIIVCIVFFFLICLNVFSIRLSNSEREKFWDVFRSVDMKTLDSYRQVLILSSRPKDNPQNQQNTNSLMIDDNGLDAEEVERTDDEPIVIQAPGDDLSESSSFRFKTHPFHPRNNITFAIYSAIFFVLLALFAYIGYIPLGKIWNEYSDIHYDANLIELYRCQMSLIAAADAIKLTSSLALEYNNSLKNANITLVSKLKETEKYMEEMKLVGKQFYGYHDQFNNLLDYNFANESVLCFRNATLISQTVGKWRYDKSNEIDGEFTMNYHIFALLSAIIFIVYVFLFVFRIVMYRYEFQSMKAILMLLPSAYSSTIANLVAKFDSYTPDKKTVDSSKFQSRYIIKQSLDAILVIDRQQKIQDINKSTIEMLGYTKDQLIGENITIFISRDDENDQQTSDFLSQLTFLNRQTTAAPRYNLHIIRYDRMLVPVSCTLLPIVGPANETQVDNERPAFALVLRDRTAFTDQEKTLHEAKKTVENLLYRILPREMANKLLSKATVLHHKVERATIIFIAIVNFLDWCRSHTHTEIMELLDVIFTKFDQIISKFPTLCKLKVINGVYMAAGGVFNEVSDNSHELESVMFTIKCAKSIKKRNLQTKSNLQLQIGINTGGPIIAGILGSDKPLFDIWGDAVNVSARLETSDPYDCIQMSTETKNALPPALFNLKEKEGVFLKGKGYTTTYILDLTQNSDGFGNNDNYVPPTPPMPANYYPPADLPPPPSHHHEEAATESAPPPSQLEEATSEHANSINDMDPEEVQRLKDALPSIDPEIISIHGSDESENKEEESNQEKSTSHSQSENEESHNSSSNSESGSKSSHESASTKSESENEDDQESEKSRSKSDNEEEKSEHDHSEQEEKEAQAAEVEENKIDETKVEDKGEEKAERKEEQQNTETEEKDEEKHETKDEDKKEVQEEEAGESEQTKSNSSNSDQESENESSNNTDEESSSNTNNDSSNNSDKSNNSENSNNSDDESSESKSSSTQSSSYSSNNRSSTTD